MAFIKPLSSNSNKIVETSETLTFAFKLISSKDIPVAEDCIIFRIFILLCEIKGKFFTISFFFFFIFFLTQSLNKGTCSLTSSGVNATNAPCFIKLLGPYDYLENTAPGTTKTSFP